MALPKAPKKRGRPLKKAKPTAAELAGIRERAVAKGKSPNAAAVLRTWENNQQRKALKKVKGNAVARAGGRTIDATPNIAAVRARSDLRVPAPAYVGRKVDNTSTTTAPPIPASRRGSVARAPVKQPGYSAPGRSGSAPGRARGNPTPSLKVPRPVPGTAAVPKVRGKSALAPGRMRGNPTPGTPRKGSVPTLPGRPKLGFSERPTGRVELPKPPRIKKRVGS